MKLTLDDLIVRLTSIREQVKDPTIQVQLDGIFYLHAKSDSPHALELIDVPARQAAADETQRLRDRVALLEKQLGSYRDAYG